jgi:hypothetical protein
MEPSHFRAAEDDPKADRARDRRGVARFSPAVKFVLMVGVMSFFADFTYEGSRSIIGGYILQMSVVPLLALAGSWQVAALAVPAAVTLSLLAVARFFYPRPENLEAGPAHVSAEGLPRAFWIYLAGAALVAAGFADFPLIAYHFQRSGTVHADLTPVFYAAIGGAGGQ